jgi:hypothetical protein
MRKFSTLNERELSRLVRKIVKEQNEFDIEKTVMDQKAFDQEDIPEECKNVDNPTMSKTQNIQSCMGKVTEKLEILQKTIEALNNMMKQADSAASASSVQAESRKYRKYRRY